MKYVEMCFSIFFRGCKLLKSFHRFLTTAAKISNNHETYLLFKEIIIFNGYIQTIL